MPNVPVMELRWRMFCPINRSVYIWTAYFPPIDESQRRFEVLKRRLVVPWIACSFWFRQSRLQGEWQIAPFRHKPA